MKPVHVLLQSPAGDKEAAAADDTDQSFPSAAPDNTGHHIYL